MSPDLEDVVEQASVGLEFPQKTVLVIKHLEFARWLAEHKRISDDLPGVKGKPE